MENDYPSSKIEFIEASIYGLHDIDGNIFYVGFSYQPLKTRLMGHIADCKYWISFRKGRPITNKKVKKMHDLNYKVGIKPIESFWLIHSSWFRNENVARRREKFWIEKLVSEGIELTNTRHNPLFKKRANSPYSTF